MGIKHGLWPGAIAGTITFVFSLYLLSPESPEAPSPEGSVTTLQPSNPEPEVDGNRKPTETAPRELPLDETVEGIAIDGAIRVDMNGNLVYDRDLRRFMDFFIGLTQSPEDEAAMRERMRQAMREKDVPETIRQDVIDTLNRYLDYRKAAANLETRMGEASPERMRNVLKDLKQLRRSHLGEAMAEGFFGREQRRIENQLARQRIQSNPDLSTDEKRERILELEENLPEYAQQVRERSRTYTNLREKTRRMREEGASDAEIHALRTRELGAEAADQLAELDDQRAQWQRRLERYRQRKQRIQDNDNLTRADRRNVLEKLRSEHFDSEAERRRARALSRIDASRQDG
ncbi:lipase secretion chaperone [Vreelandella utahensis]|uniref:lipase secretion chaperone n=1 Tax=Vreelandella halophila TaxID=86177 RepID=UPI000985EA3F|nr:lipase secretion chaperone [Halomonas utahensis]